MRVTTVTMVLGPILLSTWFATPSSSVSSAATAQQGSEPVGVKADAPNVILGRRNEIPKVSVAKVTLAGADVEDVRVGRTYRISKLN